MRQHYSYQVFWSEEDGQFIGTCRELPSVSACGDSYLEAMEGILDTVEAAVAILKEEGLPIPEPVRRKEASGRCLLRMPKSLHEAVFNRAEEESISVNSYLVNAITAFVYQADMGSRIDKLSARVDTLESTQVSEVQQAPFLNQTR